MKKFSKVSAVILALILAAGLFAVTAFATSESELATNPPPPSYHVYYGGNGSTAGSQEDSTVYYFWQKATVKGQGTLVKTGYSFAGWNTAANGSGDSYASGSEIDFVTGVIHHEKTWDHVHHHWHDAWDETTYGSKTLYAQWIINQYTMTFDSEGGSSVTAVTQDYNTTVAKPADPTKTGHTFAGWYTGSGGTGSTVTFPYTLTGNVTVYAKWTINQYTMTFNSEGGSAVAPVTQNYNTAVAQPAGPIKEGYTFAGWYTGAGGTGSAVSFPYTLTGNVTVYAKWNINYYTMIFNSDGGSNVTPVKQAYNTNVAEPAAPTKFGYAFGGWYTGLYGVGTKISFPYTLKNDITVYAKWSPNTYTLTFDSEGGSTVASASGLYASFVNSPANPSKDGYIFDGWYLGDNGTGSKAVFPYQIAGNATVYAKWTKKVVIADVSTPTASITPAAPVTSTTTISSTPTPTSVPAMGNGGVDATSISIIILSAILISGLGVFGLKKLRKE